MKCREKKSEVREWLIALAGNPNVGKSTVFNALTGMKQHTGNWPGKTVASARGSFLYNGEKFVLADIPGTYSLMANSAEEEIARDFICFGNPEATVIVADATCLERNLNLVLQVLECGAKAVVCVNLLDEAQKKGISVDLEELSLQLGVPVVGTSARSRKGLDELMRQVSRVTSGEQRMFFSKIKYDERIEAAVDCLFKAVEDKLGGKLNTRWVCLKLLEGEETIQGSLSEFLGFDISQDNDVIQALKKAKKTVSAESQEELRDRMVGALTQRAQEIFKKSVKFKKEGYHRADRRLDKLLTSRATGIPIMLLGLGVIFWITISGANYPSELLNRWLTRLGQELNVFLMNINAPDIVREPLMDGVYKTLSWVVSVMLPPMAIFFPLFTLLEDSGYLPRIAFNLDSFFKKAGAHGKQALTICKRKFGIKNTTVVLRILIKFKKRLISM